MIFSVYVLDILVTYVKFIRLFMLYLKIYFVLLFSYSLLVYSATLCVCLCVHACDEAVKATCLGDVLELK